jgi:hypothetical protein
MMSPDFETGAGNTRFAPVIQVGVSTAGLG